MLDRAEIDTLATPDEVSAFEFSGAVLDDDALTLLGFQRTKQVSKRSREAWMAGDPAPMLAEVKARGREIFEGALHEIYCEYKPLRKHLHAIDFKPTSVIDIGCGQALPDLFLSRDFKPRFTLVDIEETEEQYHFFKKEGSGYANLGTARDLLVENGTPASGIKVINPRKTPDEITDVTGNMLTSYYSCGFHYPIDEYADLMVRTLEKGGVVVLDLRKKYLRRKPGALPDVLQAGELHEIYEDARSVRVLLRR